MWSRKDIKQASMLNTWKHKRGSTPSKWTRKPVKHVSMQVRKARQARNLADLIALEVVSMADGPPLKLYKQHAFVDEESFLVNLYECLPKQYSHNWYNDGYMQSMRF